MQIITSLQLTEEELQAVMTALINETSRIHNSEEGSDSPRLQAIREARGKVAQALQRCPQTAALAA
jgi:hypothetical protein